MVPYIEKEKTRISYVVFIITLVIVVLNLVSLFFPALIVTLSFGTTGAVDPFEFGPLALPVLVTNVIIFSLMYLYLTKKLPTKFQNSINFIHNFEVSPKVAGIAIVILLGGYIVYTVGELGIDESEQWNDFENIQKRLTEIKSFEQGTSSIFVVKYFLLESSLVVFQNIKVIPFIATISVLLVTYFFTLEVTKKRFAGIIAVVILLQSYIFQLYDTMATYANFWILFYLLSLFLIYKKWYLSPVAYILSIFSKPLTALYLPLTLFFIYNVQMPRKNKIYIAISYVVIAAIIGGVLINLDLLTFTETFDISRLGSGFTTLAFQLRSDFLVLTFLIPVTVALYLTSRKGIPEADSILVLIMGILLAGPLITAVTEIHIHPYRYMPLVVFFAIGVGTLLSKKIIRQV